MGSFGRRRPAFGDCEPVTEERSGDGRVAHAREESFWGGVIDVGRCRWARRRRKRRGRRCDRRAADLWPTWRLSAGGQGEHVQERHEGAEHGQRSGLQHDLMTTYQLSDFCDSLRESLSREGLAGTQRLRTTARGLVCFEFRARLCKGHCFTGRQFDISGGHAVNKTGGRGRARSPRTPRSQRGACIPPVARAG